jgi:hypothetical protein
VRTALHDLRPQRGEVGALAAGGVVDPQLFAGNEIDLKGEI